MKVLVTGADGFAGGYLARALLERGHEVTGTERPGLASRHERLTDAERRAVKWLPLELGDPASVRQIAQHSFDAVVHLAAVASGGDALRDPGVAWAVNAAGTARLLNEFGVRRARGECDPVVLLVSSAEVYGGGDGRPLVETDPVRPRSPYAASKAGAELAAQETGLRTGLRVVTARSFPHTGPGQDERFVAPAFARRLRGARLAGARIVKTGNLDPVRDILDVRDVASAYIALLERGVAGEVYNVASGRGVSLRDLFDLLADIVGVSAIPECDPEFLRPSDITYLVGNPSRLMSATGWKPAFDLRRTLEDLVNAQAD